MKKDADADLATYKAQVITCKGKVADATKKQAAALANCKGVKYRVAQDTWNKWEDKVAKDKEKAAKVATDYAKVSAFATGGVANTRCEYPAKGKDGT